MPIPSRPDKGIEGFILRAISPICVTRAAQADGILPGRFVCRGTGDVRARLPAAAVDITDIGDGFVGIDLYRDPMDFSANLGYKAGQPMRILKQGQIYVYCETACTRGAKVWVRHTTAGGGTDIGRVRNDADTNRASICAAASFEQTLTAAGLVLINVTMVAPLVGA